MADLSKRIAELPPEKRLLLQRMMGEINRPAADARGSVSSKRVLAKRDSGRTRGRSDWGQVELPLDKSSSPVEIKSGYRHFYNAVNQQLDATEFGQYAFFLNYGYAPNENPQYAQVQLPDRFLNKNSVKLVLEVLGDCPITGQSLLDVGCGRGGTAHVGLRFFAPRSVTGVDLSPAAISFCKEAHQYKNVSFLVADAEALPFRDNSFDVLTNLESSHSYPEIERFYSEVFRVLTGGGYFLYTDVLPIHQFDECSTMLKRLGFRVEREQDVTTNVLLSCDEIARTRVLAFDQQGDSRLVAEFLGLPGSEVYNELQSGRCAYRIFKLQKTGSDAVRRRE